MGGMRFNSLTAALLFAFGISACSAAPSSSAGPKPSVAPKSFEARVIGIADGDTITVLNSDKVPQKIRLSGIDAPEKGQAFGDRSKQNLSRWVHDQSVRIEWTKVDQYGRLVAKVLVAPPGCPAKPCPATFDVNLEQISAGFAWHYKQYEKEQSDQDRRTYALAEQRAREQKLGLWRNANPMPPWDERHNPPATAPDASTGGPVRKSRKNICHDPSMATYDSVINFTAYPTLDECIKSGGRLPKGHLG